MGKMKDLTENQYNYAWQNRIMIFAGKIARSLKVIEDGLKAA